MMSFSVTRNTSQAQSITKSSFESKHAGLSHRSRDKPVYLNYVKHDSFFVNSMKGPRKFEPAVGKKSMFRGEKAQFESYLTPCPTLERLNIANYDQKGRMDEMAIKKLEEFVD